MSDARPEREWWRRRGLPDVHRRDPGRHGAAAEFFTNRFNDAGSDETGAQFLQRAQGRADRRTRPVVHRPRGTGCRVSATRYGPAMTSPTLGFSLTPSDRERVRRLAERYAGGNRSLWLRQAIELYEERALLETLADLQDRGDRLAASRRVDWDLVADDVAESAAAPYSTHADRVRVLVEEFLGDDGFDDGTVDEEAARRFITATDAAWDAYRADA